MRQAEFDNFNPKWHTYLVTSFISDFVPSRHVAVAYLTLTLENFVSDTPDYVILSHTWGHKEVTLEGILTAEPTTKQKHSYQKIVQSCKQATRDGYDWTWVDTCCIDRRSSAELSEAINSMYTLLASSNC